MGFVGACVVVAARRTRSITDPALDFVASATARRPLCLPAASHVPQLPFIRPLERRPHAPCTGIFPGFGKPLWERGDPLFLAAASIVSASLRRWTDAFS